MLAEEEKGKRRDRQGGAGARLEIFEMRSLSLSYQGWDLTKICWEGDSEWRGKGRGIPKYWF